MERSGAKWDEEKCSGRNENVVSNERALPHPT